MKRQVFTILLSTSIMLCKAQTGGNNSFEFLNAMHSARAASLAGTNTAIRDADAFTGWQNPSLLNRQMHKQAALSYNNFIGDINLGFVSYTHHFDTVGTFSAGLLYMDYGTFTRADETGFTYGEFGASDFAAYVGYGRQWGKWSAGASLKFIQSQLESYKSIALAADLSGTYYDAEKQAGASLIFKNVGAQLQTYVKGVREPLPFEVQLALTKKPKHMPFRFTVLLHNLQVWDLTYVNVNRKNKEIDFETGQEKDASIGFGGKVFRHVAFGTELLLGNNVSIRAGFDPWRRAEMKLPEFGGLSGFSWGFGLRFKRFQVNYGGGTYFASQSQHLFSLGLNLGAFGRKK